MGLVTSFSFSSNILCFYNNIITRGGNKMSKKGMAVLAVVLLVLVIAGALMGGVKAGTPMFQAVGAVLLVVALVMFFMKKKE